MSKKALSTRYTFEFFDGTTCEMTLSFIALKRLASKNKKLYERMMKVMSEGSQDEFDTLTLLYGAYRCANLDAEEVLSEDEFIELCGCDRYAVNEAVQKMTNPKNRTASAAPSN